MRKKETWMWFALVVLVPLGSQFATYFFPHNFTYARRQFELHQQVLAGTAMAAYQYQNPVHDAILEGIFRLSPRRTADVFSLCYMAYYAVGLVAFLTALFGVCHLFAGLGPSVMACIYYVSIIQMFWYDNWYHPGDPWGAFLAVLLVRSLFRDGLASYYILLLASGFVWEKHVFFPLAKVVVDRASGQGRAAIARNFVFGSALAATGQVTFRLYYGSHPAGVGSLAENLRNFPLYMLGLAVTQGLAIYSFVRFRRELPTTFLGLLLQTPAWLLLYLGLNGYIFEHRAIHFVAIAYAAPLMAILFDAKMFEKREGVVGAGSENEGLPGRV